MAQLVRTGATVEKKWSSKEDMWDNRKKSEDEVDRDKEERFKDGLRESQEKVEEGTLLFVSY